MSDVIRFPHLMKSRAQSVLDLSETPAAADDVKMSDIYGGAGDMAAPAEPACGSDANISFLQQSDNLAVPTMGWSNQELADLYRTQRILAQAGVTTEVDRGITDEGDPWFVFLDAQGEVLVHFSRFDGIYLVSSQLQEAPIKGDSLQDLVTQFSNRVRPVESFGRGAPNVVSMGKRHRDVIFIHPAAALAALVWSVYLMSDELVAATPMIIADDAEGPSGLEDGKAMMHAPETSREALESPEGEAQKAPAAVSALEFGKQGMAASANRDGLMVGLSGQSAKAVGVSLSFVALAAGLPLPASNAAEIVDDTSGPSELNLEKLSAAVAEVKAKEKALLLASDTPDPEARTIEAATATDETKLAGALNITLDTEAPAVVQLPGPAPVTDTHELSMQTLALPSNTGPREEASAPADETAEPSAEDTQTASASSSATVAKENSFLQNFDAAFKSFEITNLDRLAQDDLFKLLNTEIASEIPDTLEAPGPTTLEEALRFEAFDQEARVYLDFLLQTYSNVKVVNLPTEIIFIHMDAFNDSSGSAEIYAKSWSFEDGGTISTIGLKSDLIEFDLIA
ncbi:hypothetical protein HTT03_09685 [Sulfitobacter sp. S0837]|uniref:hypothetical protein n=1 Tax=Sulfitobacter maritimus TaxID=2741719 RepID=UPI001583655D|nr:hypothetical protein [Sulfitobacter maritimus]NUH65555.1 hypothetical protein [Sulfitobacter maritimus]